MKLNVIGTGVGRTGTYSLKLALNELGLGPCYHMEEVIINMPKFLPQWQAAEAGNPNWNAIFEGYNSTVDWPTATYYSEMHATYPDAKFVLTVRSPESWAASFSETINALIARKNAAPPHMLEWLEMCENIIAKAGFTAGMKPEQLTKNFVAHNEAVKATIPAEKLLVFDVREGWAPLCAFLGLEAPSTPFPRSNSREEFWEKVKGTTS